MHFVGPMLPDNNPPISQELLNWLNQENNVIYISFGTLVKIDPRYSPHCLFVRRFADDGLVLRSARFSCDAL